MVHTLVLFSVWCIVLVKSSGWLVRSVLKIAEYLKVSEFKIGFAVLAVSTTLPELLVGIDSALDRQPELALGTAIGSNIINLTFILGISLVLGRHMAVDVKAMKSDSWTIFLISVLPLVLLLDGVLSTYDGIALLLAFAFYLRSIVSPKAFHRHLERVRKPAMRSSVLVVLLSFALLYLSADQVVNYAEQLAIELSMPVFVIGLFLVAIGTSLPELSIAVRAALSKHSELAIGDLAGAAAVNSSLVLGVASVLHPIPVDLRLFGISGVFLLLVLLAFTELVRRKALNWKAGIWLVLAYLLFTLTEFYVKSLPGW